MLVPIFFALYLLPVVLGVAANVAYVFWLISAACLATVVLLMARWRPWAAVALAGISGLGNLLLCVSLFVQASGFNEAFFFHLNLESVKVARQAFPLAFFGGIACWLASTLWPLGATKHNSTLRRAQPYRGWLWLLGIVTYAPLLSAGFYAAEQRSAAPPLVLPVANAAIEVIPLADPRNLVFIFAESLEATYSDSAVFGTDLTPRLSALASEGVNFTDMRQVAHTGWTMGGLVAAQCAIPINADSGGNTLLANVDRPLPSEICLGDVLKAYGYQTMFMGGASPAFAGKGNFLNAHGFDAVHGRESLAPRLGDGSYQSPWGIYDDSLFELARQELASLSANGPFALVLLTLDTHHPDGFPSASCDPSAFTGTLHAVTCADQLITDFIADVRTNYDDTVIAVFSDHLAHRNDVYRTLQADPARRGLRFFLLVPDLHATTIEGPGTHFDVMPTLMEALGIDDFATHRLGSSRLSAPSRWYALGEPDEVALTAEGVGMDLRLTEHVTFHRKGPMIQLGERHLLASHAGLPLHKSVFAVAFTSEGRVDRIYSARDFDRFQENVPEGLVLGISSNRRFNDHYANLGDTPVVFFAGHLGSEKFSAGPLWWQQAVDISPLR